MRFSSTNLSLRTRLSLATLALVACIVVLFYIGGRYVVIKTVRQAENEVSQIRLDVERSITRELLQLCRLAGELASDTSVTQAEDRVLCELLGSSWDEAGKGNQLDLILLRHGEDNDVRFCTSEGGAGLPKALQDYLGDNSPLLNPAALSSASAGLVSVNGKMMLVATAAIGNLDGTNIIMVGRNMSDQPLQDRVGQLRRNFSLQIMVRPRHRLSKRTLTEIPEKLPSVFGRSHDYVPGGAWHLGRDLFETVVPLRDLHGDTIGAVSITLPSTFRALADELLDKLLMVVCVVGVAVTLLIFYSLTRAVVAPLRKMIADIIELAERLPEKTRLDWNRLDEFGQLADTFDGLLARMEDDAAQILEREQESRALFAALPDVFCVFSRDGILQTINCGTLTARNITDRLQVGETIASTGVSEEVVETFGKLLKNEVNQRSTMSIIFPGRPPEQHDLHAECRLAKLDDQRVLAVFRDLTAEQKAQERMAEMEGKLLQLQRQESLGHLASGVAHDFNNLLEVIHFSLERLQEDSQAAAGSTEKESLKAIAQATRQATELTRQLQVFAGVSDISFEQVNLNSLLSSMWAFLRASVPHHIDLRKSLAPHLPEIVADSSQLVQVISNLVLNATEAIGANPGIINVDTFLARGSELQEGEQPLSDSPRADWYVRLTVSDNGGGMAPGLQSRILEPFFSTKREGRGLGLATVAAILSSHDALLSVTSMLGKGTTFHVYLPAASGKQVFEEDDAPLPRSSSSAGSNLRVLLVEDDNRIRSILRLHLESLECEVMEAGQEAEARVLIQRHAEEIDLLVLDANIRGMDGVRVLRAMRQKSASVPAWLISGHDEASVQRVFGDLKYDGFIAKPFSRDAIVKMLEKIRSG